MVHLPDEHPLDGFFYLSAPYASLYTAILSVFADARRNFRLNLRATEVTEVIKLHRPVRLLPSAIRMHSMRTSRFIDSCERRSENYTARAGTAISETNPVRDRVMCSIGLASCSMNWPPPC